MIQRRISDSPEPAAPVNSGEPLKTIATREPPSSGRFILEIMCCRKRNEPSLMRGRPAPKRPLKPLRLGLLADLVLDLLPLDPERRIGEQVVEALALVVVLGEGVAVGDVGGVLALEHHVGAADRVGLGVQLLAEDLEPCLGVEVAQVVLGDRQHAAGAAGRVAQRLDDARLGEDVVVVVDEQQVHHQPDDLARREVLAGGLVGELREPADQLLVEVAHLDVRHRLGVQVDLGELADDLVEQVRPVAAGRSGCSKSNLSMTSSRRRREAADVELRGESAIVFGSSSSLVKVERADVL